MLLRFDVQEMALFFKEKHVVPLRPIDGAVFQKSMLSLYVQQMALLFQKKHVFTFTCHRCDIYIYKLRANLLNCAV
jgi:hypothetical protein